MSPQKLIKAISTSVLSSIYALWPRIVVLLSAPISIIVGVVRRIRTGNIGSQHYNEFINIAKYKQRKIYNQTLEQNRPTVVSDKQAFRQCILQGEQQAKCFTLALLLVVFVGIIIKLW